MLEQSVSYQNKVEEAVNWLDKQWPIQPRILVVLGTGLNSLPPGFEMEKCISYDQIPHFPQVTVTTHLGRLLYGSLGGNQVAILQGRFHYYEGYSTPEITFPIRVLSILGCKTMFISNCSGGLNLDFSAGSLMVITDHLNFIGENPLRGPNVDKWGPRFPDMSSAYSTELIKIAGICADSLGIRLYSGVYVAIPGPSLETPAETRFLKNTGADAVGMSTVPEVIVANHGGMKIFGLSIIANVNDPDNFKPIILEEVIEQVQKTESDFLELLGAMIEKM